MAEALITPAMISWARERAGLSCGDFASKLNVPDEKILAWESGDARPTFKQAEKIASVTHVPFGALFLDHPPREELPIPDLRTTVGAPPPDLDGDFRDALSDVLFKFEWFKDFRLEQGAKPRPYVGRFPATAPADTIVADIKKTLGYSVANRLQAKNADDYLRVLVRLAEDQGVWVLRNGVVGANNRRPLSAEVFRGFAVSDPVLPTVFINGRDAPSAQVFTLIHEIAHIWLGKDGISNPFTAGGGRAAHARLEKLCNSVAEQFLTPREEFLQTWRLEASMNENTFVCAKHFKVSGIVAAIRAKGLGLVEQDDVNAFYRAEMQRWRRARDQSEGGGDYYRTSNVRNGGPFVRAVLGSAMSGRLLLRDAGALLNMKPKTLQKAYSLQVVGDA
ncbi:ImmA/IrrE family metallo-endopeptidase [Caenispirillum salinarum]|uniref:ImmA/IrrE family metallo-endopeptidase n=1 Tax=Caenispirillum salinarum TaxID=859058 RepID=UPI000A032A62|nr:ImmA/IrrE family metallo-endopeptidase [Caenispirillum salinarum]